MIKHSGHTHHDHANDHERPQRDLLARTRGPLTLALWVAIALLLATPAAAQYSSYGPGVAAEPTAVDPAVQDAIDDAADDVYEQLFTELSEDVALQRSCSIILEPQDPIGASCSCTASGAGAACGRTNFPNGKIQNVWCKDATGVTTCRYTGPPTNRKKSCACF